MLVEFGVLVREVVLEKSPLFSFCNRARRLNKDKYFRNPSKQLEGSGFTQTTIVVCGFHYNSRVLVDYLLYFPLLDTREVTITYLVIRFLTIQHIVNGSSEFLYLRILTLCQTRGPRDSLR